MLRRLLFIVVFAGSVMFENEQITAQVDFPITSGRIVARLNDLMNEQIRSLPAKDQEKVFRLYESRFKQLYADEKDDVSLRAIHDLANLLWSNGVNIEKARELQRFVIAESENDSTVAKAWHQIGVMGWGEDGSASAFKNAARLGQRGGMSSEFVASNLTHQASIELLIQRKPEVANVTLLEIFTDDEIVSKASSETILIAANYVLDMADSDVDAPSYELLLDKANRYLDNSTSDSEKMTIALGKMIQLDMKAGQSKLGSAIERLKTLFRRKSISKSWVRVKVGLELLLLQYANASEIDDAERFAEILEVSKEVFTAIEEVEDWEKASFSKPNSFVETTVVQALVYQHLDKVKRIAVLRTELRDPKFNNLRFQPYVPRYLARQKYMQLLTDTHKALMTKNDEEWSESSKVAKGSLFGRVGGGKDGVELVPTPAKPITEVKQGEGV